MKSGVSILLAVLSFNLLPMEFAQADLLTLEKLECTGKNQVKISYESGESNTVKTQWGWFRREFPLGYVQEFPCNTDYQAPADQYCPNLQKNVGTDATNDPTHIVSVGLEQIYPTYEIQLLGRAEPGETVTLAGVMLKHRYSFSDPIWHLRSHLGFSTVTTVSCTVKMK